MIQLAWLAMALLGPPVSVSSALGLQECAIAPALFIWVLELNSIPHACLPSTLLRRHLLSPLRYLFLNEINKLFLSRKKAA